MKFTIKKLMPELDTFKITAYDYHGREIGYLEFSPPNKNYNKTNIINIQVKEKRKGIGTCLINYLKTYIKEKYNSTFIEVMDIDPIEINFPIEALIKFYKSNGFKVSKNKVS